MKKLRYELVIYDRHMELLAAVNRLIEKGWVPVGGVTMHGNNFIQAMYSPKKIKG